VVAQNQGRHRGLPLQGYVPMNMVRNGNARIMIVIVLNLCTTSGKPMRFSNNSEILIEGRSGTCPYEDSYDLPSEYKLRLTRPYPGDWEAHGELPYLLPHPPHNLLILPL